MPVCSNTKRDKNNAKITIMNCMVKLMKNIII